MSFGRFSSWLAGGRRTLLAQSRLKTHGYNQGIGSVLRVIPESSQTLSNYSYQIRRFRSGKSFGASTMDPKTQKKPSSPSAPSSSATTSSPKKSSMEEHSKTESTVTEEREEEKEAGLEGKSGSEECESLSELEKARRKSDDSWIIQVDSNNQIIGRCKRSSMRRNNLWHRSSYVFVLSNRISGDEIRTSDDDSNDYLLIQKRVHTKDYCPGYLDCCTGGIVESDETDLFNAQKEIAEEIGIDIIKDKVDMKYICTLPYKDDRCSVFANIFEIHLNSDELLSKIKIQETEVESVHWKRIGEIESEMELLSLRKQSAADSSDDQSDTTTLSSAMTPYCPDSVFVFSQWIAKTSRGSFTEQAVTD